MTGKHGIWVITKHKMLSSGFFKQFKNSPLSFTLLFYSQGSYEYILQLPANLILVCGMCVNSYWGQGKWEVIEITICGASRICSVFLDLDSANLPC